MATALVQTEKQFQAAVVEYAEPMGWRTFHPFDSRRSNPGFPDLTMVRRERLIFAELKRHTGRVSSAQSAWLMALARVDPAADRIEVHLWRPSDWPEIEGVLA